MKKRVLLFAIIFIVATIAIAFADEEVPEITYTGYSKANEILNNIDYLDLRKENPWSKEAIYTAGSLGIMKGYGDRDFGRQNVLTREQAMALAYRMAGREAEAQLASEKLPTANIPQNRGRSPDRYWADGYFKLAVGDGLITQSDYNFLTAQSSTASPAQNDAASNFLRDAPSQRQEFAFYLGKLLALQGNRNEESIYNNFADWKQIDAEKIPYIEALLEKGIMNGDGSGNFKPKGSITREQAAAIITNSVDILPKTFVSGRKYGTVSKIEEIDDRTYPGVKTNTVIDVRNSNGKLHRINVSYVKEALTPKQNELKGKDMIPTGNDLVVYKDGQLGDMSLLSENDRIEYISDGNNAIRFVKIISSKDNKEYVVGRAKNVDTPGQNISLQRLITLDYPQMFLEQSNYDFSKDAAIEKFAYQNDLPVYISGKKYAVTDVQPEEIYLFTIENDVIIQVQNVSLTNKGNKNTIINGIVKMCDTVARKITFYDPDGSVADSEMKPIDLGYKNRLVVTKNFEDAQLEDVRPGDRVFAKLDNAGVIVSISDVDDTVRKYGNIISVSTGTVRIQFDDGTTKLFGLYGKASIYNKDGEMSPLDVKPGDRVGVDVKETIDGTTLVRMEVEGEENFVTDIYKGILVNTDKFQNKFSILNVQKLTANGFMLSDQKGVQVFNLAPEVKLFYQLAQTTFEDISKNYKMKDTYFAVKKRYGDLEEIVHLIVKQPNLLEDFAFTNPVVFSINSRLSFNLGNANMFMTDETICVKNGRLVKGVSIKDADKGYAVLNRDEYKWQNFAEIVRVKTPVTVEPLGIYWIAFGIDYQRIVPVENLEAIKNAEIYRNKRINIATDLCYSWSDWDNKWKKASNTYFVATPSTRVIDQYGVRSNKNIVDIGNNENAGGQYIVLARGNEAVELNYNTVRSNSAVEGTVTSTDNGKVKLRNAYIYVVPEVVTSITPTPRPTSTMTPTPTPRPSARISRRRPSPTPTISPTPTPTPTYIPIPTPINDGRAVGPKPEATYDYGSNVIVIKGGERVSVDAIEPEDTVKLIKDANDKVVIIIIRDR